MRIMISSFGSSSLAEPNSELNTLHGFERRTGRLWHAVPVDTLCDLWSPKRDRSVVDSPGIVSRKQRRSCRGSSSYSDAVDLMRTASSCATWASSTRFKASNWNGDRGPCDERIDRQLRNPAKPGPPAAMNIPPKSRPAHPPPYRMPLIGNFLATNSSRPVEERCKWRAQQFPTCAPSGAPVAARGMVINLSRTSSEWRRPGTCSEQKHHAATKRTRLGLRRAEGRIKLTSPAQRRGVDRRVPQRKLSFRKTRDGD